MSLKNIRVLILRIHIAVTKHHTKSGIKEKFVQDVKDCVKSIMARPDRKLGKTVRFKFE